MCLSELDPHGAYGTGNPIGGNVTSNITGADENIAEWMVSKVASAIVLSVLLKSYLALHCTAFSLLLRQ